MIAKKCNKCGKYFCECKCSSDSITFVMIVVGAVIAIIWGAMEISGIW